MKRGYLKPSFNIFLLRCVRASYLLGLYEFVEYFDHEFMSTRRYNDIFEEIFSDFDELESFLKFRCTLFLQLLLKVEEL